MVSESEVFAPVFPICLMNLAFLKVNLIRKDQGQEGIQQPFLYPLSPGLLSHVQQTAIIFPTLPSAAAVLMEVLPVALYIPCQIHLQVGFGFLNPIPAWSVSLHSSWVSCPLPCASFYYLTFFFFLKFLNHPCWSSLIIHAGLTPPLLDFPICWDRSILILADTIPETQPALLDLCLQNHHRILPGRSLKRPKSASLRVAIHLFVLLPPSESWMPTSHGSWSLQPKHLFFFFFCSPVQGV